MVVEYFHVLLIEVKHHKAMVCNGGRYWIKKLDETKKTSDSGVSTIFELTDIHKSQKIDTMGIWKILYSMTLNPLS